MRGVKRTYVEALEEPPSSPIKVSGEALVEQSYRKSHMETLRVVKKMKKLVPERHQENFKELVLQMVEIWENNEEEIKKLF